VCIDIIALSLLFPSLFFFTSSIRDRRERAIKMGRGEEGDKDGKRRRGR
jgi:hypothetical protein